MNAAAQPTTVTASKKNKKSKKDRKRKHCEELDVSLDTKHSRPSKEFGTSTIPIVTNTDDVLNQEARADVSVAYKKKRKKKKKKDRRVKSSHAGDSSVVDSNEDTTKTVSPVTTNDSNISTEGRFSCTVVKILFCVFLFPHVSKPRRYFFFRNTNRSIIVQDVIKMIEQAGVMSILNLTPTEAFSIACPKVLFLRCLLMLKLINKVIS